MESTSSNKFYWYLTGENKDSYISLNTGSEKYVIEMQNKIEKNSLELQNINVKDSEVEVKDYITNFVDATKHILDTKEEITKSILEAVKKVYSDAE